MKENVNDSMETKKYMPPSPTKYMQKAPTTILPSITEIIKCYKPKFINKTYFSQIKLQYMTFYYLFVLVLLFFLSVYLFTCRLVWDMQAGLGLLYRNAAVFLLAPNRPGINNLFFLHHFQIPAHQNIISLKI